MSEAINTNFLIIAPEQQKRWVVNLKDVCSSEKKGITFLRFKHILDYLYDHHNLDFSNKISGKLFYIPPHSDYPVEINRDDYCESYFSVKCFYLSQYSLKKEILGTCGYIFCLEDVTSDAYECEMCSPNRKFCSKECYEKHLTFRHFEKYYCYECQTRLEDFYYDSYSMNKEYGKDLRFCSIDHRERFRCKNFCAFCDEKLGDTYWHGSDIDDIYYKEKRFCSKPHLKTFRAKNLCAECGDKLPSQYWHSRDIDRVFHVEKRFCSTSCLNSFRQKNLCYRCGDRLGRRYVYNRLIGDHIRFCSDYCHEREFGL